MVVGNVPEAVDFVVAGAGPGGYVAALRAARAGRQVVLIDRDGLDGVGGVCLQVGCIPSKALIEVADLKHCLGKGASMGLASNEARFDLGEFQRWKGDVIGRLTGGVRVLLEKAGVEVLAGGLALVDAANAVVNLNDGSVRFLEFRDLVLATGSAPVELDPIPLNGDSVLDSTGVLALTELPASIAVIGAGYIGIELGMALAKLGSRVTMVETEARILPNMEETLSTPVKKRMQALGIELLLSHQAEGFENGILRLKDKADQRVSIEVEKVLIAVGRRPNTKGIGLRQSDIEIEANGHLLVGDDRRITPHIAAIGDLTPGPALAHKAMAEAKVAVDALSDKPAAFDVTVIPEIIFSDPEIASAGLTASQAQSLDIDACVARFPFAASGRAATMAQPSGFTQVVADRQDHTVLGVHIVGPHASELIAQGVLAIEMGASLEDLALIVHPHPTLSETLGEAAEVALGQPLHALG